MKATNFFALGLCIFAGTWLYAQESSTESVAANDNAVESQAVKSEKNENLNTSGEYDSYGKDFYNAAGLYGLFGTAGSGYFGLEYQRWITPSNGLEIQFFGISNDEIKILYNFNVVYIHSFFRSGTYWGVWKNQFYGWVSLGVGGEHSANEDPSYTYFGSTYADRDSVNIGGGLCFDFILANHISCPVRFGFLGEINEGPILSFALGSGLRYRF